MNNSTRPLADERSERKDRAGARGWGRSVTQSLKLSAVPGLRGAGGEVRLFSSGFIFPICTTACTCPLCETNRRLTPIPDRNESTTETRGHRSGALSIRAHPAKLGVGRIQARHHRLEAAAPRLYPRRPDGRDGLGRRAQGRAAQDHVRAKRPADGLRRPRAVASGAGRAGTGRAPRARRRPQDRSRRAAHARRAGRRRRAARSARRGVANLLARRGWVTARAIRQKHYRDRSHAGRRHAVDAPRKTAAKSAGRAGRRHRAPATEAAFPSSTSCNRRRGGARFLTRTQPIRSGHGATSCARSRPRADRDAGGVEIALSSSTPSVRWVFYGGSATSRDKMPFCFVEAMPWAKATEQPLDLWGAPTLR